MKDRIHVGVWTLLCIAWLVVIWTWRDVYLAMIVDDAFYYLKTAHNLARGAGSTFDGIHPTNGYHPLWFGLLAVVAPLPVDMVVLCRIVLSLQVAMVFGGGLLLARLREVGGPLVLWPLALVMANPVTAKIVLCGQESALQFLLTSATLVWWWSNHSAPRAPTWWRRLALPVLCATLVLARLDAVFFCLVVLAMPLLVSTRDEAGLRRAVLGTARDVSVFALCLLPYLLTNLLAYDHAVPVSGAIKLRLDGDEVASSMVRVVASLLAAGALVVAWYLARRRPLFALLLPPIGAVCLLSIYNFGVRGEMSAKAIRIWYLEPHLLLFAMLGGWALQALPARRLGVAAVSAAAFSWVGVTAVSWSYRLDPRSYNLYAAAERCSRWLEVEARPDAVAAAWDAGFVGAFTRKPVMNLDGLISSWEFKKYLDRGAVDEYILRHRPVDYVVQYMWPNTLTRIAARFHARPIPDAPEMQTSVTGKHDPSALSARWGVDLAFFHVVHDECIPVSVAYAPGVTHGAVHYLVLSRTPLPHTQTLAEFALAHAGRPCESPTITN